MQPPFNTKLIAIEGYAGGVDASYFKSLTAIDLKELGIANLRQEMAKAFLDCADIRAVEYLALTEDALTIYGIEDMNLYGQNWNLLSKVNEADKRVSELDDEALYKEMLELMDLITIDTELLSKELEELILLIIDSDALFDEMMDLIDNIIVPNANQATISELNQLIQQINNKQKPIQELYKWVCRKLKERGFTIDPQSKPNAAKYCKYLVAGIDLFEVYDKLELLGEKKISFQEFDCWFCNLLPKIDIKIDPIKMPNAAKYCQFLMVGTDPLHIYDKMQEVIDQEISLWELYRWVCITLKKANIKIDPAKMPNASVFSDVYTSSVIGDFYRLVDERSTAFVTNLLDIMNLRNIDVAVLVMGAAHEGVVINGQEEEQCGGMRLLKEGLKKKNVSYAVITPKGLYEGTSNWETINYDARIGKTKTAFGRWLTGDTINEGFIDGKWVEQKVPTEPEDTVTADVNHDKHVDIFDLVLITKHLGKTITEPIKDSDIGEYNPDVNGDKVVDVFDLAFVSEHFDERYGSPIAQAPVADVPNGVRVWLSGRFIDNGPAFEISVILDTNQEIYGVQLDLQFDPNMLAISEVSRGEFLENDNNKIYWQNPKIDSQQGYISGIALTKLDMGSGMQGSGKVVTVRGLQKHSDTALLNSIRIKGVIFVDPNGKSLPVTLVGGEAFIAELPDKTQIIPEKTCLLENFPNPSNPETWIPFQLKESANVVISIYDTTGRSVRTLNMGYKPAGYYVDRNKAVYWDGRNDTGEEVASGVYFYELWAGNFRHVRKMLILR